MRGKLQRVELDEYVKNEIKKEEEKKKKKKLKKRLLLAGIGGSFALVIIFIVVIIATLMVLGIIDVEGLSSSSSGLSYADIGSSSKFWWPIGSDDTQTEGGIIYASGNPPAAVITSGVGPRWGRNHGGIDISGSFSIPGPNIIASQSGTVEYASENGGPYATGYYGSGDGGGYGNHVIINHGNGYATVYAHLYQGSITVKTGDTVRQGQLIGRMGSSGSSTGVHLHFEVRQNGARQDPENYVSADNPRPVSSSSGSGLLDFSDFKFVAGVDDKQSICLTLKANGLSDVATAGIMGNIEQESTYSPAAVNGGGCIGIVQWCDRSAKVIEVYGDNWKVLENQLEFVFYELANNESANKSYLSLDISASDMAYRFCEGYERPGHADCLSGKRQNFAKNVLSYVQNGCK